MWPFPKLLWVGSLAVFAVVADVSSCFTSPCGDGQSLGNLQSAIAAVTCMHCYFKLLFIVLFQAFIQVSLGSPKTFGDKWSSVSRSDALYVIQPSVLYCYPSISIVFYY